jgi:hypothetical protein
MNAKIERMEPAGQVPQDQQVAITPMGMMKIAIEKGTDLDQLQKLMDLQERWERNESRKAFVTALTAFKSNPPTLTKNKHVKFGTTEYDHATLDKVTEIIGKALSAHGLSHRWEVEQKDAAITVACVITHEKGHSERVQMQATADTSGSKNSIQAIGSTVTYLQRYTLLAATGLAAKGQDDDGLGTAVMDEGQRRDFEAAIDSNADAAGLEKTWKTIVAECRKTPKDLDSYNALKARVAERGKQLKGQK